MNNFFKTFVKKITKDILGYNLINKKTWGYDILHDISIILSNKQHVIVFDIGANIGDTTFEFATHLKNTSIYAFEPDPTTYEKLNKRVGNHKMIKTYNLGFGDQVRKMQLNIMKGSGGNSLLHISEKINQIAIGDWAEHIGFKEVNIVTLNSFCKEQKIEKIDILKIDTQGYEKKILEGGDNIIIPAFTKIIYIEVLFVELYKQQSYFIDLYKILTDRGYKLVGFYNQFHKVECPHYMLWCDALFVSDIAISKN